MTCRARRMTTRSAVRTFGVASASPLLVEGCRSCRLSQYLGIDGHDVAPTGRRRLPPSGIRRVQCRAALIDFSVCATAGTPLSWGRRRDRHCIVGRMLSSSTPVISLRTYVRTFVDKCTLLLSHAFPRTQSLTSCRNCSPTSHFRFLLLLLFVASIFTTLTRTVALACTLSQNTHTRTFLLTRVSPSVHSRLFTSLSLCSQSGRVTGCLYCATVR